MRVDHVDDVPDALRQGLGLRMDVLQDRVVAVRQRRVSLDLAQQLLDVPQFAFDL